MAKKHGFNPGEETSLAVNVGLLGSIGLTIGYMADAPFVFAIMGIVAGGLISIR